MVKQALRHRGPTAVSDRSGRARSGDGSGISTAGTQHPPLERERAARFATTVVENLSQPIDHCLTDGVGGSTPRLPEVGLDQAELDRPMEATMTSNSDIRDPQPEP